MEIGFNRARDTHNSSLICAEQVWVRLASYAPVAGCTRRRVATRKFHFQRFSVVGFLNFDVPIQNKKLLISRRDPCHCPCRRGVAHKIPFQNFWTSKILISSFSISKKNIFISRRGPCRCPCRRGVAHEIPFQAFGASKICHFEFFEFKQRL